MSVNNSSIYFQLSIIIVTFPFIYKRLKMSALQHNWFWLLAT